MARTRGFPRRPQPRAEASPKRFTIWPSAGGVAGGPQRNELLITQVVSRARSSDPCAARDSCKDPSSPY
eukprot:scaffold121224_cov49-Prasinocladus_malaysianus.AAC.1